ncbi:MAG TPA: AAA family ATPase, partial [Sporomusaceae bacterium]|nr:AAA family ATPase [Sporomusaceae bacterium]
MKEQISIQLKTGETHQFAKGSTLLEISTAISKQTATPVLAAKVNNDVRDLQSSLQADATIELLDLTTEEGIKVYQRSLTFVMIVAAAELFPDGE